MCCSGPQLTLLPHSVLHKRTGGSPLECPHSHAPERTQEPTINSLNGMFPPGSIYVVWVIWLLLPLLYLCPDPQPLRHLLKAPPSPLQTPLAAQRRSHSTQRLQGSRPLHRAPCTSSSSIRTIHPSKAQARATSPHGKFGLSGIPPALVVFLRSGSPLSDVDANGILNISALDETLES